VDESGTAEPLVASASGYMEIEISDWLPGGFEQLGTKPKMWLREPESKQMWLFKSTTRNNRTDGTSYLKGDDWAERIATEVARLLGLPVAETELALVNEGESLVPGTISKKILADDEDLIHGNELLAEIGVVGKTDKDRTGYNAGAVRVALAKTAAPIAEHSFSAWDWFVGYLALDSLVGNTDRHQENWAVIDLSGARRLAPTFDHASSLGFQLDDADRARRLSTNDLNQRARGYAARARSRFEGKPRPSDVFREALEMVSPEVRDHWIELCASIPSIEPIVDRIPKTRMSTAAREFACQLYEANRELTL
jgi:hypothetical protein